MDHLICIKNYLEVPLAASSSGLTKYHLRTGIRDLLIRCGSYSNILFVDMYSRLVSAIPFPGVLNAKTE